MGDFVHLHTYTSYTPQRGGMPVDALVRRAAELGQNAVAVTDNHVLHAAPALAREAAAVGIRPIFGCCLSLAARSRFDKSYERDATSHSLVALCKTEEGYSNLARLSTLGFTEGFYVVPRIDLELLAQYREGLILLSGGVAGPINHLIRGKKLQLALERSIALHKLMEGDFYLELEDHGLPGQGEINSALAEISSRTGIPLLATNSAGFATVQDYEAWSKLHPLKGDALPNRECILKSHEEMSALFSQYPQAVENTCRVAEQCRFAPEGSRFAPPLPPSEREELMADLAQYARDQDIELRHRGELRITCAPRERHRLVQYLEHRLGDDRVIPLFSAMPPPAADAVREVGQAMFLPHEEIERLARLLPRTLRQLERNDALWANCRGNNRLTRLYDAASALLARELRLHPDPAALLLTPEEHQPPLFTLESRRLSQYPLGELARTGSTLLVLDPSSRMSVVGDAAQMAQIDWDSADHQDLAVYELLRTTGLVLAEHSELTAACRREKPRSLARLEEIAGEGEGLLAYQAAFLQLYHPVCYLAALLNDRLDHRGGPAEAATRLKAMKIPILAPDINASRVTFGPEEGGVRFALAGVRNVSLDLARQIEMTREQGGPYASFGDFCSRLGAHHTPRAVESLVRAGAFDRLDSRSAALTFWRDPSRRAVPPGLDRETFRLPEAPPYPLYRLCRMEWEETGLYFSGHPLEACREQIEAAGGITVTDALETRAAQGVTVAGVICRSRLDRTKEGRPMVFFTLEDGESDLEAVAFSESLGSVGAYLKAGVPLLAAGDLILREGALSLTCRSVTSLAGPEGEEELYGENPPQKSLWLRVEGRDDPVIEQVHRLLCLYPGTGRVRLYDRVGKKALAWNRVYAEITDDLVAELKEICGEDNVAVE